jgi:2-oxo-4-hydroxy-4-carboxy--5-ureidoimidazoline (OHCU) decarboxylase
MEKEIDSIRQVKNLKQEPIDFQKMNERYYDLFDLEWKKHFNAKNEMESLEKLEKRIRELLK